MYQNLKKKINYIQNLFWFIALIAVLFLAPLLLSSCNKKKPPIKEMPTDASLIHIAVDSSYLFSVVEDLTLGTGANISLVATEALPDVDADYKLSLQDNAQNNVFYLGDNIEPNVILFGENYLYSLDLINYETGSGGRWSISREYKSRKDNIKLGNYHMNPLNGETIVKTLFELLSSDVDSITMRENMDRMIQETDNAMSFAKRLGEDYFKPAVFYMGESTNIAWMQDINKNIKIITLIDSKTEKASETYPMFLAALKSTNANKVLVDASFNKDFVALLRQDMPDITIIYLQTADSMTRLGPFYKDLLNTLDSSIVSLP